MPKVSKERNKRFKKDDFALQLMVAIGDRPVSIFCKNAGLDYKMVKDYMNEARDIAPGFKFLKRVANFSCDKSVDLNSLALASGFTARELANSVTKTKVEQPIKPTKDVQTVVTRVYEPKELHNVNVPKNEIKKNEKVLELSTFINLADTYDEYSPVKYYIFDSKDAFKKFGKLVRLYGLNKAMESAEKGERPIFELDGYTISKFLSDKPIAGFSALNGNKIAIVF